MNAGSPLFDQKYWITNEIFENSNFLFVLLSPNDRRRHIGSLSEIERRSTVARLNDVLSLRRLKNGEEHQSTAENLHRDLSS